MPDEPRKSKKSLVVVLVALLVLGAVVGAWLVFKSRQAKASNIPPIAALRLDSLDETNRVATLSDNGSRDPDGTLRSWRIAWGDGKEDNLSAIPQKSSHTYASEGDYTISLWCVDNYGATSSLPAMTNITFDFQKRQQALQQAQAEAEAKRQADRLKEEQARKEGERLEQERQKELAAQEARKAMELEEKQKAEAELSRQKAKEAAETAAPPPPTPLAAALPDNPSSVKVIFTPPGYTLGEIQIFKENAEGTQQDGNQPVILVVRCVNFPNTPIATSDWQIDGKDTQVPASRIRASLSSGRHDVTALLSRKAGTEPGELKADVTVRTNGDCVVTPGK